MPPKSQSLTNAANGILRELKTACGVSQGFDPSTPGPHPASSQFTALWDTGATNSVITQAVVDACGLQPVGMTQVHGVNSVELSEVYFVNIMLPSQVGFMQVRVTKGKLPAGAEVLIGMDIITIGDFVITNQNGCTTFSFRVPSETTTDYVKEHRENVAREQYSHGGSKKKHKHKKRQPKTFGKNKQKKK